MKFRLMMLAIPFVLASVSTPWASHPAATASTTLAEAEQMARSGSAVAQTFLGLVHDVGEGVPQDPRTAANWYRMAADQGNPDAQMFLGSAYLEGRGVHRNLANALLWLNLAANGLQGEDKVTCEAILEQAVADASEQQLTMARRRAANWQPETAGSRPAAPRSAKSWARRLRYQATLAN